VPLEPLRPSPDGSTSPSQAVDAGERARRLAQVQQAEADFEPLPFDAAAARAFGRVSASFRRSGRKSRARTLDALIASTAISNGLPLYKCNPTDFEGIEGLTVRAVVAG
jgi:tRNA(fMet)-specific endonuclease VapC